MWDEFQDGSPATKARSLSRRHDDITNISPAFTRNVVEHLGNNPDTYYIIGADYRIAEPSERGKATSAYKRCRKHWVQRPRHHRERLVDVGSPARRTPPAETKQQKGYLNQRELAECRATARVACVQATAATASSPHEFVRTSPRTRLLASNRMMLHQSRCRLFSGPEAECH